jgi:hypothetical protein
MELPDGQCVPFYDKKTRKNKPRQQVKEDFKCQLDKSGNRMLYFKKDENEFDSISKNKLNKTKCIQKYNHQNPEPPLQIDDLVTNCSRDAFNDLNPEYVRLLTYHDQLTEQLEVDPQISKFILNIIMYTNINYEGLQELYKGAFVIIQDNGFFYSNFKCPDRICDTRKLVSESSHESVYKTPQYRIGNGVLYNCSSDGKCSKLPADTNKVFDLLIGTSVLPLFYGNTWFQFEYANLLTPWNKWALHAYSFIQYKIHSQNIGPLGNSPYLEYTQPLVLSVCYPCEDKKCDPVPCVRSKINLNVYSVDILQKNNVRLREYKQIKDYIKSNFGHTNITLHAVIKSIMDVYEASTSADLTISTQVTLIPEVYNLLPSLQRIVTETQYNREEIIEILFFIHYYISNNMLSEIPTLLLRYPVGGKRKTKRKLRK